MGHIVYGGKVYYLDDQNVEGVRERVERALKEDALMTLNVSNGPSGAVATLFVTRGVSIAVNNWDAESFQP